MGQRVANRFQNTLNILDYHFIYFNFKGIKMYGYIYITENLINHKKYIGRHKSEKFDSWYIGSGIELHYAILKYGKQNFSTKIICECESEEDLNEKEIFYIDLYNAVESADFYNISKGGDCTISGLVHMYDSRSGKTINIIPQLVEEYISKGFVLGTRPRSQEQIERYKKAKKDVIPMTDGYKTFYIKKPQLSEYESKGYRHGRATPTRPEQKLEHRKWLNKDRKSVMVKEEDIQEYIDNGYTYGRCKFSHFNRTQPAHNKGKKLIEVDGCKKYV